MKPTIADLTGYRGPMFVVLGREGMVDRRTGWRCRCQCGAEFVASRRRVMLGKSCGCARHRQALRSTDLTGHRFGMMTVLSRQGKIGRRSAWLVRCDCGNVVTRSRKAIIRNNTCGCGKEYASADAKFDALVDKSGECWVWTGPRGMITGNWGGYGRLYHGKQAWQAHRYAWERAHGAIPDGLFVCHHCDNPPCVRPEHLFLGTVRDNAEDMARKGRSNKGKPRRPETILYGEEKGSKLTADEVREIRRQLHIGTKTGVLAEQFGVTASNISMIATGRSWRWLDA